ncbi:MAG: VOC family protein [Chitinophagales bacterium]|nr:VOC family protein [Chitinophagales bacterium]
MTNKIYPCIWCNNNAKEMAEYYANIFPNCHIAGENPMVVMLEISGQKFMLLNGGNMFTPNPSISFMYLTDKSNEIDEMCEKTCRKRNVSKCQKTNTRGAKIILG